MRCRTPERPGARPLPQPRKIASEARHSSAEPTARLSHRSSSLVMVGARTTANNVRSCRCVRSAPRPQRSLGGRSLAWFERDDPPRNRDSCCPRELFGRMKPALGRCAAKTAIATMPPSLTLLSQVERPTTTTLLPASRAFPRERLAHAGRVLAECRQLPAPCALSNRFESMVLGPDGRAQLDLEVASDDDGAIWREVEHSGAVGLVGGQP